MRSNFDLNGRPPVPHHMVPINDYPNGAARSTCSRNLIEMVEFDVEFDAEFDVGFHAGFDAECDVEFYAEFDV